MESRDNRVSADLEQFIAKFEPNKFKVMTDGIEVRGINDMHRSLERAKELIQKLKLKLVVNHNAEMLSYGGFEVKNI